jgi:hypothetical protein
MTLAVAAEEPIDDAPPPAMATKFKAHAADLESKRNEYAAALTVRESLTPIQQWAGEQEAMRLFREAEMPQPELRSLKYRKSRAIPKYKNELVADLDKEPDEDAEELPDEDAVPDDDAVVSDVEDVEPEEDDTDEDNEEPEGFSEPESETSEGSSYYNDQRFCDDEDAVGRPEGHDHLEPMYEDATTKETDLLDHDDLQSVRDLIDAKAEAGEYCRPGDPADATIEKNGIKVNKLNKEFQSDSFIVEWILTNATKDQTLKDEERWLAQATARLQTTMDALYQRRQELLKRSRAMRNNGGSLVPDEPKLTYAQAVDIADCGATYIKVKLNDRAEWTWYKVDVEKHGSVAAAIEALKLSKLDKALGERLRKAGIDPDETQKQRPEINVISKDVRDAYDKAFHIDRMQIVPVPTTGLIGLVTRFGGK